MNRSKSPIRVFDYTDYRLYLDAYYKAQKAAKPHFSFRYFARKAGISSIGLFKDVITGKQSLSRRVIGKFSEAIGHSKREAAFFEDMVFFTDAKSVDERNLYFERMMANREARARLVTASNFEYYEKWYYSAIRALLSFVKFDGNDFEALARKLSPPIKSDQAQKAISVLSRLSLICKNEEGYYVPNDQILTTGALNNDRNVHTLSVVNLQKSLMSLAAESYDRYPAQQLDMSTITLSVSKVTRKLLKEELAAFRKKVLNIAENDPTPECAYQLNFQFFPITNPGNDPA